VFHEVRVPLNTIRLGLDSVPSAKLDADTAFVLACLDEATTTISDTLNDVLSYQKIMEGKVELCAAPFEVDGLLRGAVLAVAATAEAKALTLHCARAAEVSLELVGDACRLRQVLAHFLSNALKFTQRGGAVTLRARLVAEALPAAASLPAASSAALSWQAQTSSSLPASSSTGEASAAEAAAEAAALIPAGALAAVEFSVADSGCGIAPEDQGRLFEAYAHLRSGDLQSGRGSGLGMSISKHLVELMGGHIHVRSQLGHGSTFFCTVK
jgi:hypothetical protein